MIDLGAVYVDRKGWAQSKLRGTWDSLARRNLPWTPAEDARLLRRHAELSRKTVPMEMFVTLSTEHGRSGPAVMTRLAALRAGIRFAEMIKKQNAPLGYRCEGCIEAYRAAMRNPNTLVNILTGGPKTEEQIEASIRSLIH